MRTILRRQNVGTFLFQDATIPLPIHRNSNCFKFHVVFFLSMISALVKLVASKGRSVVMPGGRKRNKVSVSLPPPL